MAWYKRYSADAVRQIPAPDHPVQPGGAQATAVPAKFDAADVAAAQARMLEGAGRLWDGAQEIPLNRRARVLPKGPEDSHFTWVELDGSTEHALPMMGTSVALDGLRLMGGNEDFTQIAVRRRYRDAPGLTALQREGEHKQRLIGVESARAWPLDPASAAQLLPGERFELDLNTELVQGLGGRLTASPLAALGVPSLLGALIANAVGDIGPGFEVSWQRAMKGRFTLGLEPTEHPGVVEVTLATPRQGRRKLGAEFTGPVKLDHSIPELAVTGRRRVGQSVDAWLRGTSNPARAARWLEETVAARFPAWVNAELGVAAEETRRSADEEARYTERMFFPFQDMANRLACLGIRGERERGQDDFRLLRVRIDLNTQEGYDAMAGLLVPAKRGRHDGVALNPAALFEGPGVTVLEDQIELATYRAAFSMLNALGFRAAREERSSHMSRGTQGEIREELVALSRETGAHWNRARVGVIGRARTEESQDGPRTGVALRLVTAWDDPGNLGPFGAWIPHKDRVISELMAQAFKEQPAWRRAARMDVRDETYLGATMEVDLNEAQVESLLAPLSRPDGAYAFYDRCAEAYATTQGIPVPNWPIPDLMQDGDGIFTRWTNFSRDHRKFLKVHRAVTTMHAAHAEKDPVRKAEILAEAILGLTDEPVLLQAVLSQAGDLSADVRFTGLSLLPAATQGVSDAAGLTPSCT